MEENARVYGKFDVTEAQQNAYAATDPIAQKESARVADACRAMLLDGLNAACGVSISNLSIVEDDSFELYNSDVFKKQRLLIAKECGRRFVKAHVWKSCAN